MKNFCHLFIFFALSAFVSQLRAQVIWSEDFSYPDGISTGTNKNTANPANDWTSSCGTCIPTGDWFEVRAGKMEGTDTNGEASLTTEVIDISSALSGVEVLVDLEEVGTMEGCPGGVSSGCNSIDWIRIEYSVDGGGFTDFSSALGGPCSGSCAGNTYVTIDDFGSTTFNSCTEIGPIVGNTLQLIISGQNWAASESFTIDNIIVQNQNCVLPVQFDAFSVIDLGNSIQLNWIAGSEDDIDHFVVMRSTDGISYSAIGDLSASARKDQTEYQFEDDSKFSGLVYYRIKIVEINGTSHYGPAKVVNRMESEIADYVEVYPNPAKDRLTFEFSGDMDGKIMFYDVSGRMVKTETVSGTESTIDISELESGIYGYVIMAEDFQQAGKVMIH